MVCACECARLIGEGDKVGRGTRGQGNRRAQILWNLFDETMKTSATHIAGEGDMDKGTIGSNNTHSGRLCRNAYNECDTLSGEGNMVRGALGLKTAVFRRKPQT